VESDDDAHDEILRGGVSTTLSGICGRSGGTLFVVFFIVRQLRSDRFEQRSLIFPIGSASTEP
jgi:hypothetical protein